MPYARCMGKMSRTKGATGEREVVKLAKSLLIGAERTSVMQAGGRGHPDVALLDHPDVHLEVKRDERMSVDAMLRQAVGDAPPGCVPMVAWRRNACKWYLALPLDVGLRLIDRQEM